MKRQSAARARRETEGMTKAKLLAYWRKGTEALLAEQEALRAATNPKQSKDEVQQQPFRAPGHHERCATQSSRRYFSIHAQAASGIPLVPALEDGHTCRAAAPAIVDGAAAIRIDRRAVGGGFARAQLLDDLSGNRCVTPHFRSEGGLVCPEEFQQTGTWRNRKHWPAQRNGLRNHGLLQHNPSTTQ